MDPIDLNLRVGRLPAASEPTGGELSAAEVDENFTNLRTAAEQLDDEKAPKAKYISTTAPDPAVTTDWFLPTGEHFVHDGTNWFQVNSVAGADGADGADGAPGAPGAPGASAYQIAVANGFVGTEVQWLASLEGADGTNGTNGADGAQGISGDGAPVSVSLAADQAFSTTSLADVTGATLTLAANTDYKIELIGSFTSAATSTGIGLALNVGGTVTRISGQVQHPTSATAIGACSQEANNAVTGATTGVRATGVPVSLLGVWHVRMGATGGTAQLRCRSEIAGSAVTLQAGTRLRAHVL